MPGYDWGAIEEDASTLGPELKRREVEGYRVVFTEGEEKLIESPQVKFVVIVE